MEKGGNSRNRSRVRLLRIQVSRFQEEDKINRIVHKLGSRRMVIR